jgi:hypothetical protein
MSEFKFACPVCGQHITADRQATGTQLECPTCFRKIVVPQAPASGESKFILAASQVSKPRPGAAAKEPTPAPGGAAAPKRGSLAVLAGVILLCAGGVVLFVLRDYPRAPHPPEAPGNSAASGKPVEIASATPTLPGPTSSWTLTLTNAVTPEISVAGALRGHPFAPDRAVLQGGNLSLRHGGGGPPDLGINIMFFARQGEELSGKTAEVMPDRAPPLPRVTLRWKDADGKPVTTNFQSGYALKVSFGQATNGRIAGKLYLALPDEARSFVAGSFDAEIRKPPPPKPPKIPKNPSR